MEILIFQLVILLFSAVIHEVSHGIIAYRLGDSTAKLAGRLTLNPIKHLDLMGSFILPLSLFLVSGGRLIFGWAKPVPFNPYNLKKPKRDSGLIAAAGPLSNIIIAIVFGLIIKTIKTGIFPAPYSLALFFEIIVLINLSLAVFNAVPIPPLDGSKILAAIIPESAEKFLNFLEKNSTLLLFAFIIFGFRLIAPIIIFLHNLII